MTRLPWESIDYARLDAALPFVEQLEAIERPDDLPRLLYDHVIAVIVNENGITAVEADRVLVHRLDWARATGRGLHADHDLMLAICDGTLPPEAESPRLHLAVRWLRASRDLMRAMGQW